jgi:hypothetical protein
MCYSSSTRFDAWSLAGNTHQRDGQSTYYQNSTRRGRLTRSLDDYKRLGKRFRWTPNMIQLDFTLLIN